jgi:exopolysaccharide biosynthesis predicted pyruvyltransferase EpsI
MTQEDLKKIITETLLSEIKDNECCLLDIPNHRNSGDHLIWQGEIDLLKNKIYYSCCYHFFDKKKIKDDSVILLHGGGNFGDIYRKHQDFRNFIISNYPKHKIIILPQTVHYNNEDSIVEDSKIFNSHNELVVCVRDNNSFKLLSKHFTKNKILLLPDMAFCSDYSAHKKNIEDKKALYIARIDVEKMTVLYPSLIKLRNLTVSDWPSFQNKNFIKDKFRGLNIKVSKFLFKLGLVNYVDNRYGVLKIDERTQHISKAIAFLTPYNLVITNRLHGFILSYLLGIPTIILDNSYGKNFNFYTAWLKNSENVYFAKDDDELNTIISTNFSHLLK